MQKESVLNLILRHSVAIFFLSEVSFVSFIFINNLKQMHECPKSLRE